MCILVYLMFSHNCLGSVDLSSFLFYLFLKLDSFHCPIFMCADTFFCRLKSAVVASSNSLYIPYIFHFGSVLFSSKNSIWFILIISTTYLYSYFIHPHSPWFALVICLWFPLTIFSSKFCLNFFKDGFCLSIF